MKPTQWQRYWVRNNDGVWAICDYMGRTPQGWEFRSIADESHKITLPPDSPWIKDLTSHERTELERIESRMRAIAQEDDDLFCEIANMSFKKD